MRIARVFPTLTNFTPIGKDCFVGIPNLTTEKYYDEVHISCTFTWDKEKALNLQDCWRKRSPTVKVGGPAFGSPSGDFVPGFYVKSGVTFTSRGCPNTCKHCLVPKREGKLRELPITEGHIINDNNFLACSENHLRKVFDMLKKQKRIEFSGGLEASRITPKIADELRGLRIKSLFLACDTDGGLKPLRKAIEILQKFGFTRSHLYCYALIGDNMDQNELRLREIWNMGANPFAQLFQPADRFIEYSHDWRLFATAWSRAAIMYTRAKNNWPIITHHSAAKISAKRLCEALMA